VDGGGRVDAVFVVVGLAFGIAVRYEVGCSFVAAIRSGEPRLRAERNTAQVCLAGAGSYWTVKCPTGAMTPTVVVGQVRSAWVGRERADSKSTTAGKRTGSEAGRAGELARNSETQRSYQRIR
jgi:hypothetical protein